MHKTIKFIKKRAVQNIFNSVWSYIMTSTGTLGYLAYFSDFLQHTAPLSYGLLFFISIIIGLIVFNLLKTTVRNNIKNQLFVINPHNIIHNKETNKHVIGIHMSIYNISQSALAIKFKKRILGVNDAQKINPQGLTEAIVLPCKNFDFLAQSCKFDLLEDNTLKIYLEILVEYSEYKGKKEPFEKGYIYEARYKVYEDNLLELLEQSEKVY
jgi:hypothetical protein